MATKMSWDWVRGRQVMVFTTFLSDGKYRAEVVFCAENPEPPWRSPIDPKFSYVIDKARGHEYAATRAFQRVNKFLEACGEFNPTMKGLQVRRV